MCNRKAVLTVALEASQDNFSPTQATESRSEKVRVGEKGERAPQGVLCVQRDAGSPGYTYFKLTALQQKWDSEGCGQRRGR